jgi:hypothetical protein
MGFDVLSYVMGLQAGKNGGSSDTFLLRPGIYIINLGDKNVKFSVN